MALSASAICVSSSPIESASAVIVFSTVSICSDIAAWLSFSVSMLPAVSFIFLSSSACFFSSSSRLFFGGAYLAVSVFRVAGTILRGGSFRLVFLVAFGICKSRSRYGNGERKRQPLFDKAFRARSQSSRSSLHERQTSPPRTELARRRVLRIFTSQLMIIIL